VPHARLNAIGIALLFVGCAIAITPLISEDSTEEAGLGPLSGAEVELIKHAEAVYIFSVKPNSAEVPNQKALRRLGPEARQALADTLSNLDNWNWVTGGSEDCEPHDVGLLFQKSKDSLILSFCSVCDPRIGCGVDGTFRKSTGGWIKQQPWESWKRLFAQLEMRK
jgi:hypothetical protein